MCRRAFEPEFAEFLRWFIERGLFNDLLALLSDETITIYDYAFATLATDNNGVYSLWNIQFPPVVFGNWMKHRIQKVLETK